MPGVVTTPHRARASVPQHVRRVGAALSGAGGKEVQADFEVIFERLCAVKRNYEFTKTESMPPRKPYKTDVDVDGQALEVRAMDLGIHMCMYTQ